MTILAKRCHSIDEVLNGGPGCFFITPEKNRIYLQLPKAGFAGLNVAPTAKNPRTWALSGTEDKPTLSPSIDSRGVVHWHGHLSDGEFHEV